MRYLATVSLKSCKNCNFKDIYCNLNGVDFSSKTNDPSISMRLLRYSLKSRGAESTGNER